MCILQAELEFPPPFGDHIKLAFTIRVSNTSLQLQISLLLSPPPHRAQDATVSSVVSRFPFNQHSKQAAKPQAGVPQTQPDHGVS